MRKGAESAMLGLALLMAAAGDEVIGKAGREMVYIRGPRGQKQTQGTCRIRVRRTYYSKVWTGRA